MRKCTDCNTIITITGITTIMIITTTIINNNNSETTEKILRISRPGKVSRNFMAISIYFRQQLFPSNDLYLLMMRISERQIVLLAFEKVREKLTIKALMSFFPFF